MLLTCGAFTPDGKSVELPELDLERLRGLAGAGWPWQRCSRQPPHHFSVVGLTPVQQKRFLSIGQS